MSGLLGFLSGPFKDVVGAIGDVIDKLTTTEAEKLDAKAKLAAIQAEFELKMAGIEATWVEAQRDVIVAEAKGESWLQRNWRPILMMFFAIIIGTVVWTGGFINGREVNPAFIEEILNIIKIGLGGYVVGRTAEKIVPQVAGILTTKNK